MTPDPQLAQMTVWLAANDPGWRTPRSPDEYEVDGDSILSGRMSRTARAESRRPFVRREPEPWADEVAGCDVHRVAS